MWTGGDGEVDRWRSAVGPVVVAIGQVLVTGKDGDMEVTMWRLPFERGQIEMARQRRTSRKLIQRLWPRGCSQVDVTRQRRTCGR